MASKRLYDPGSLTAEFLGENRVHAVPAEVLNGPVALLVLDMMGFFCTEGSRAFVPSSRLAIPAIRELVADFTRRRREVIFTRHVDRESSSMVRWWGRSVDGEGAQALALTAPGPIVEKHSYDAFHDTSLDEMLRAARVRAVAVCGVMTHLCCETTARSAFVRGYDVLFVSDATATLNEDYHRASLLNLAHGLAFVVPAKTLLGTGG